MTIEARIGGDGITAPYLAAVNRADRIAMIDRWLAEHGNNVMLVEVKRDDPRSWEDWRQDKDLVEYVRVGVAGDRGAAEYVRHEFESADWVIHATFNAVPSPDEPGVLYDEILPLYFPAETVLPLDQVRRLMVDFVLTGEWSDAVPWRAHENLVA